MAGQIRYTIAMALLGWVVAACSSPAGAGPSAPVTEPVAMIDFATLQRPGTPNRWLIGPEDAGDIPADAGRHLPAAAPDAAAPAFAVPAARLAQAWREVVASEPRTTIIAVSDDGLQIEAEQASAVFGFVDRISARFLPLANNRSTLIAYSRATVGYWDLGVNRDRLNRWLALLSERVAAGADGKP